ncbi:MAG: type 1 glutamine amidotransferase [Chloroflexi bacterium]|nr:MAG: type 1 glutamine amidotransferase [Chloroflexota bacterium]
MRVACVLDVDFEDSEYRGPRDALAKAGHEVTVVGRMAGTKLTGKKGKEKVTTDVGIDDVSAGDFDALLIPGGYSPDHLRADRRMVDFARAFFTNERPVFAICHGPQLLMTARVVRGRRMTAWTTVQDDLDQVGADVVDEEVVVDRRLVTSRKPDDVPAFSREAVRMLETATAARR